jgi:hypothetical protein
MMYLPSGVIMAWVTIAPKGLSASFDISFPIRKFQTPTQFRVTVTAKLKSSDKLKKQKSQTRPVFASQISIEFVSQTRPVEFTSQTRLIEFVSQTRLIEFVSQTRLIEFASQTRLIEFASQTRTNLIESTWSS